MIEKHRPWGLFAALILAVLLAGCQAKIGGEKAEEDEEETPPIPVEVAEVNRGDVVAVYSGTAPLEADGEAMVVAKVGGEIVELLVEEGDSVEQGQVLARLDGDRLRLEQRRARANLDKARKEYDRNLELHEKGLLPAGTFESLRYDLDALKAAYDLARLDLAYSEIRAPIAGTVSERVVKLGNTIAVGEPLFQITDLDPLLAYLHVPERDFGKLAPQQIAELRFDALSGDSYPGHVARISPVVDSDTGTFKVTIEVDDKSGRLKPGMFSRINIVYDTRDDVVMVPRAALVGDEGDESVYVVDGDEAKKMSVTTGYASGAEIEITSGLAGGERIVVIGHTGLKDGGKVQVIDSNGIAQPEAKAAETATEPDAGS